MTRIDTRQDSKSGPRNAWKYRALLDGEDVSPRCFLADDETGEVGLYLQRDGSFYLDPKTNEAAVEFRSGVVTLIPPE